MTKLVVFIALFSLFGCERYPTKAMLKDLIQKHDPGAMQLEPVSNGFMRRAHVDDIELGIIELADGSSSKYWFRSHHRSGDIGGTWFQMSDGTATYMAGGFCCEVQLPDQQLRSLSELRAFIEQNHGISP